MVLSINFCFCLTDDLEYNSVLPLEVHGANYVHMKLLTKQSTVPQTVSILEFSFVIIMTEYYFLY